MITIAEQVKYCQEFIRVVALGESSKVAVEKLVQWKYPQSESWCSAWGRTGIYFSPEVKYRFALAVVEDKPVFEGDVVYGRGEKRTARECGWYAEDDGRIVSYGNEGRNGYTWNPPKRKLTISDGKQTVEVPAELVEQLRKLLKDGE